jgi:2,5-diketo-D-gluconate reductase A
MRENMDVFDFDLSDEVTRIGTLDRGQSFFCDHRDPATVSQLGNRRLG